MGGAIRSQHTGDAITLRGVTVEANRSPIGGGVAIRSQFDVVITSHNGRPTVFRNNTSSAGGGLLYDCGDTALYRVIVRRPVFCFYQIQTTELCAKVENSSFVGNRVFSSTDSDFAKFVEEGYTYDVYPPAAVNILNVGDLFDNATNIVTFRTTDLEGHGGAIALSLIEVRPSNIIQILFQNLVIEGNEAVVGGASHTGRQPLMTRLFCRWHVFRHDRSVLEYR